MSSFYSESHRQLQDALGSRQLADAMVATVVREELDEGQVAFIEAQNLFFLSSIDAEGRPTVSYKGGDPGFVRVLGPTSLMFPSFDGNGMFYSTGNIQGDDHVGLLFIDFQKPNRLRVQGRAELLTEGAPLHAYPGADLVVRVTIEKAWVNCPRYVHKMSLDAPSPYVPDPQGRAPVAAWKRIEGMAALLSEADQAAVAEVGTITHLEYLAMVEEGRVV